MPKKDAVESYLMMAPMLVGFAIFTIYPMIWLIRWSWFRYDGMTSPVFIGIENYIRVFTRDKAYWQALSNTFAIVAGKMVLEIPMALFLAVALNSQKRINAFFRTIFFSPAIVSTAIVGIVFFLMFEPFSGSVNMLLKKFHFIERNINWFGSHFTADFVIVIASVWRGFGTNMIFFIMGLQNIPQELYECASLDGVTTRTRFSRITLPMLAPTMRVVMMLFIVNAMKMSDLVLVLTNGQPGGSTEVVMSYAFKYFFSYGNADAVRQYGFSSAIAVTTAVILGVIIGAFMKATKRIEDIY
jgi:raffinose/stachyose/melibiose transport system permease protein